MTILVVGASGATGRLLLEQLLNNGERVKAIVRSTNSLPQHLIQNVRLTITQASLLDMSDSELEAQVQDCQAVACCLGHNITFKGLFGHPRRLVTDSVKRLCQAIEKTNPTMPVKFVLMNTTGNQNKQAGEKIPLSQYLVVGLLRHLLPRMPTTKKQLRTCNYIMESVRAILNGPPSGLMASLMKSR